MAGRPVIGREAWLARPPRSRTALGSTDGVKIHYTGEFEDSALLEDHRRCAARVRSIQDHHMDGNGWDDIAYNLLVCLHGQVFEGRGPHVLCAANGAGRNAAHYAVCGLLGNSGVVEPTAALLTGLQDAVDHLRRYGGAGHEVKGHRDGNASTDCPGEALYAWLTSQNFA